MPQLLFVFCQIHYVLKWCIILTGIFSKETIQTGQLFLPLVIILALYEYNIDRNGVKPTVNHFKESITARRGLGKLQQKGF